MAREKTLPAIAFEAMLKRDISPLMKAAGYRKKAFHYRRKEEAVSKVFGFISSRFGSTSMEKIFDVVLGVQFEEICQHYGMEMPDKPLNYIECMDLGINAPIALLYPAEYATEGISLRNNSDAAQLGPRIAAHVDEIIANLSQIDDLESFRQHEYFHSRALREAERAVIYYLLGEKENCRQEFEKLMKLIEIDGVSADRGWHLERLKLPI